MYSPTGPGCRSVSHGTLMVISPMPAVAIGLETLGSNAKMRGLREVGLEMRSGAIKLFPVRREKGRRGSRRLRRMPALPQLSFPREFSGRGDTRHMPGHILQRGGCLLA